jgi:hypothetical protein
LLLHFTSVLTPFPVGRPVTLTISDREKKARRFLGVTIFLLFCFFYTIPLALTSQLLNPEKLAEIFPQWEALQEPDSFFFQVLSGISSGLLYTVFFSFCPQLFKAIANFEGNVSSKRAAEDKALTYFWFFMMVTAFTGTTLAQMLSEVILNSASLGKELKQVLAGVADSIPTQQASATNNFWIPLIIIATRFAFLQLPICIALKGPGLDELACCQVHVHFSIHVHVPGKHFWFQHHPMAVLLTPYARWGAW